MGKSTTNGYFGLSWIVSVILAVIPFTNILFGIVIRVTKKKYLLAILNFFLAPLFWLVDLISMIINKKISWLI